MEVVVDFGHGVRVRIRTVTGGGECTVLKKTCQSSELAKLRVTLTKTLKSNITVTFTDAMKEDSGVYNCTLWYFDRWGYMQREKDSTNFTIENNNAHDVIRYFVGELKSLQNQLAELDRKTTIQVEKVEAELEHQSNDTEILRRQHEKDIDTLKTQMKTLETQTTNHITKANLQSGFMAGLKSGDSLLYAKTIKFRDVQLNTGNHFDYGNGVYTAPWDGLYTFYLTVGIRKGNYCRVSIRVNGRLVSSLIVWDSDNEDQSSVSAFVSLKAGDTVDAYGSSFNGKTTLFAYSYPYTYFSGFLIKAT